MVVVDDHPAVRSALRRMFRSVDDIELVGAAADDGQAAGLCRMMRPDVVLMDLRTRGVDGIEAIRRIAADRSAGSVVVFTAYPSHEHIERALAAGAVAYVGKHESPETIIEAIRAAGRARLTSA